MITPANRFNDLPVTREVDPLDPQNVQQERSDSPSTIKCKVIWACTAGLITAEAFNGDACWIVRLSSAGLPANWMIFPFNPFKAAHGDPSSNKELVCRVAILSLSFLSGVCLISLANYKINSWSNSDYSLEFNVILFIMQATFLFVNLLACRQLHLAPPQEKRLKTLQLVCWMRNKIHQSIENVKNREEIIVEPSNSHEAIAPSSPAQSPSNQSALMQNIVSATFNMQQSNKRSERIFDCLEAFINQDPELRDAYQNALERSKEWLLPPYQNNSSYHAKNADLEAWRQAQQEEGYWDGRKTRVRDFLSKNPDFASLLSRKFNESAIMEKRELLDFFFPTVLQM